MIKKIITLALIGLFFSLNTQAQETKEKIGFTSAIQIMPHMPEFKTKEKELEEYVKVLQTQLESKGAEFKKKLAELSNINDLPPIVVAEKQKELEQMQKSYQEFDKSIQEDIQKRQQVMLQPIYTKIQKNINAVAEANGYTLIINGYDGTGMSLILYYDESDDSLDVTNLVLKEMGIDPPKEEENK
jgi:outer membrane protein